MTPQPPRPPLFDVLGAQGCEFAEWEGRWWPDHFGDPIAEHHAVRRRAGVWDQSSLRKWEFAGPAALRAADHIFTHNMLSLRPGQVRYAPFCDAEGNMIGDGTVFTFNDEHAWVFTARDADGDHFRRAAGEMDVTIHEITDRLASFQIQGPLSRYVLAGIAPAAAIEDLRYFHFRLEPVEVAGVDCWIARLGYSGELGYELFCPPRGAGRVWDALTAAGVVPYGLAAVETLRIEAGLIMVSRDYTPHATNPYDLSLDRLIRLEKPGFHGQDALLRAAFVPPRRLVTLLVNGDEVPARGAAVTHTGTIVGRLTSPCRSPTLQKVLGLAVVDASVAGTGTRVEVHVGGADVPAEVVTTPVYDPRKRRVRS